MLTDANIARVAYISQRPPIVKRRRLSVEAHPILICEDVLGSIVGISSEGNGGGGDDDVERLEAMINVDDRFLHALVMSMGDHSDDGEEEED